MHKNQCRWRFITRTARPMNSPREDEPWERCYEQLATKLLLFARQWLPAQVDAEDAVQSAFVKFWRRHPDAQPEHYPLLYAAVRTTALDALRSTSRRARRETASSTDGAAETTQMFELPLEQCEETLRVEFALRSLPLAQREVVVLRIWGELTFAEIAESLGESINTVAARYRYGLEALRKTLTAELHERLSL
jgi:RNA polymerase sigma-70 factor (ECF subfamily)